MFARFGGVMMNGGEEPGGGDWTCDPTGGYWWMIHSIYLLGLGGVPEGPLAPNRTVFCRHIGGGGVYWGFWYCLHILTSLLLFIWGVR